MYRPISDRERAGIAPHIWRDVPLVSDGASTWVVKCKPTSVDEEKRDYLAYLLGRGIVNVAEVKLLTDVEHQEILALVGLPETSTTRNTFLTRHGSTYEKSELPCRKLEEAIAGELVFSVWIRRRDAHGWNRIFIDDIPVFFDFQTAFLGEEELQDIAKFFSEPPPDTGHASAWRIVTTTMQVKTTYGTNPLFGSAQFVHDPEAFNRHADRFLNWIVGMDLDVIRAMPRSAGFNPEQQRRIAEFLTVNQRTLPDDVSTMMRSLYKPFRMLGVPQDAEAANLRARLLDLQGELAEIKRSKAHRAALMLRQIRLVLAPPASRRTRVLGWILRRVGALFK